MFEGTLHLGTLNICQRGRTDKDTFQETGKVFLIEREPLVAFCA